MTDPRLDSIDSPRVVQEVVVVGRAEVRVEWWWWCLWCLRVVDDDDDDDVQELVLVVVFLPVAVAVEEEPVLPFTLNLLDWARMPLCWSSSLWTRLIWKPELGWLVRTIPNMPDIISLKKRDFRAYPLSTPEMSCRVYEPSDALTFSATSLWTLG